MTNRVFDEDELYMWNTDSESSAGEEDDIEFIGFFQNTVSERNRNEAARRQVAEDEALIARRKVAEEEALIEHRIRTQKYLRPPPPRPGRRLLAQDTDGRAVVQDEPQRPASPQIPPPRRSKRLRQRASSSSDDTDESAPSLKKPNIRNREIFKTLP